MAIHVNRYSPDTCGCVIDYQWDDEQTGEDRQHTLTSVVSRCPAHAALPTNGGVWDSILDENPRKNNAYQLVLDNGPTTLYDILNGFRQPKPGINITWSWSGTVPNRVLTLNVVGLTLSNAQKSVIRTALNTRFGTGRVTLQ